MAIYQSTDDSTTHRHKGVCFTKVFLGKNVYGSTAACMGHAKDSDTYSSSILLVSVYDSQRGEGHSNIG